MRSGKRQAVSAKKQAKVAVAGPISAWVGAKRAFSQQRGLNAFRQRYSCVQSGQAPRGLRRSTSCCIALRPGRGSGDRRAAETHDPAQDGESAHHRA